VLAAATPVISISTQPAATTAVTEGSITGSLTVAATLTQSGTPAYQWYSNAANSNAGGSAIGGATSATFALPAGLTAGTYYYYCQVTAAGATAVSSTVAVVTVSPASAGGNIYYITESGGTFTARTGDPVSGTIVAGANGVTPVQTAVDAIKADAAGANCTISFEDGTNTLDIGINFIEFNGGVSGTDWGLITLTGKITSAQSASPYATIYLTNSVSANSTADIANTANSLGEAVRHNSTGTLNITGGTVTRTNGSSSVFAVRNISTGTVNIGGTAQVFTNSNSHIAVRNDGLGTVNIGGTAQVSASNAYAIYNGGNGKITVSDNAAVSSANTNTSQGTVYLSFGGGSLEITGGTVSNTAAGGNAVYNDYNGSVLLGGDPVITGKIRYNAGELSVITGGGADNFAPASGKMYTLDLSAYSAGLTAVTDGATFGSNFQMYNGA
jgi:hypothetical protein